MPKNSFPNLVESSFSHSSNCVFRILGIYLCIKSRVTGEEDIVDIMVSCIQVNQDNSGRKKMIYLIQSLPTMPRKKSLNSDFK